MWAFARAPHSGMAMGMVGSPCRSAATKLATLLLVTGCGGAPPPPATPVIQVSEKGPPEEVARFMPLEDGTVFSYDTRVEGGPAGVMIMQITRPKPGRVELKVGARPERLELDAAGIQHLEGGYLLRAPLTKDATWRGKSGTVRVADVGASITVPAGNYEGCLRTVEETREPGNVKVVTSVYCPHVGLVSLDVEANTQAGHEHQTVVLRSFGPRVDLTSNDVTTTGVEAVKVPETP